MRRTTLLAALLVVGLLAAPALPTGAQEATTDDDDEVSPGEQLSGVVGVQDAEFEGELSDGAFAIALERADDNSTRAVEIAARLNDTERRLAELEERRDRLDAQRENGEISDGEYRARTARLVTEGDNAHRQLNRSEAASADIPEEILKENGVNVTAIRTLRQNASELTGPEVSEIARSIAGERRGTLPETTGEREGVPGTADNPSNNATDDAGQDERADGTDGEVETVADDEGDDERGAGNISGGHAGIAVGTDGQSASETEQ